MSTGAHCVIYQEESLNWYYKMQRYPWGETNNYDTHGPFKSDVDADQNMQENYPNPGAVYVRPHKC